MTERVDLKFDEGRSLLVHQFAALSALLSGERPAVTVTFNGRLNRTDRVLSMSIVLHAAQAQGLMDAVGACLAEMRTVEDDEDGVPV